MDGYDWSQEMRILQIFSINKRQILKCVKGLEDDKRERCCIGGELNRCSQDLRESKVEEGLETVMRCNTSELDSDVNSGFWFYRYCWTCFT